MTSFVFNTKDYILYLLHKMGGEGVDKIKLNKVAFFVEFGYMFKKQKELSDAKYAGINLGPVINDYLSILRTMQREGSIVMKDNKIKSIKNADVEIPKEVTEVVNILIDRYRRLSNSELVSLSHLTDSYKITTNNEKKMGGIIDKKLASLETFFEDTRSEESVNQNLLPKVKPERLRAYGQK